MKTLKLDHELAELVRQGIKTSTWRIFDDKNITVGDDIELIDKVDPYDKSTWQAIPAIVVKVIEKSLEDISGSDFDGHEPFESSKAMLTAYRKYYGPKVTMETTVKMIYFQLKD